MNTWDELYDIILNGLFAKYDLDLLIKPCCISLLFHSLALRTSLASCISHLTVCFCLLVSYVAWPDAVVCLQPGAS